MVELVGHAALAAAVANNVNEVVLFEDGEQLAETDLTVLAVVLGEEVTSAGS